MSRNELIRQLLGLQDEYDTEDAHWQADKLIIDYMNDPEIEGAYSKVKKWYA